MSRNRVCYFDVLRVVSIFFVIVIHVTSAGMKLCAPVSAVWRTNWLINSISRWAVPVFFMVSGALFLEPSKVLPIKKLYKKNILRLVNGIVIWGLLYSLLDQYLYETISVKSILVAIYGILTGNTGYHLWFLYTLLMLYVAAPLFRLITSNASKGQLEYALVMWGVCSLLIGQINYFAAEAGLGTDLLPFSPFVITGYGGYFLLGYYLKAYPLHGNVKKAGYILAAVSVCAIIFGKLLLFSAFEKETVALELPLGILSCLLAVMIFTMAQNLRISDNASRILDFLGQRVFGIYLTHVIFVSLVYHIWNVQPDYCQPALAVFTSSVGIFVASLFVSWMLSKIPLLRRLV